MVGFRRSRRPVDLVDWEWSLGSVVLGMIGCEAVAAGLLFCIWRKQRVFERIVSRYHVAQLLQRLERSVINSDASCEYSMCSVLRCSWVRKTCASNA